MPVQKSVSEFSLSQNSAFEVPKEISTKEKYDLSKDTTDSSFRLVTSASVGNTTEIADLKSSEEYLNGSIALRNDTQFKFRLISFFDFSEFYVENIKNVHFFGDLNVALTKWSESLESQFSTQEIEDINLGILYLFFWGRIFLGHFK